MNDLEILRIACRLARRHSQDPRTQNAAILTRGGDSVWAVNRFPEGVERVFAVPAKYDRIEHAERGVIYSAARAGWITDGATMYAPWFACPSCARSIALAGIVEVVGLVRLRNLTPERWERSVAAGEAILREAGVATRWLASEIGDSIMFDGKVVRL